MQINHVRRPSCHRTPRRRFVAHRNVGGPDADRACVAQSV